MNKYPNAAVNIYQLFRKIKATNVTKYDTFQNKI